MKQEHVTDSIPAYALGILEADEQVEVAAHLGGCPDCQTALAEYEAVAAELAMAAPQHAPPAYLKDRLRERLQESAPLRPDSTAAPLPAAAPAGRSWTDTLRDWLAGPVWRPALLVVLLVAALGLLLRPREATAPDTPAVVTLALVGTENAPDATGVMVLGSHYRPELGTLVVDHLEPLPPGQQYQLWLINGGRISGGVFDVGEDGYGSLTVRAPNPLDSYTFGVTIEPAGGSPGPTGPRVLASAE